MKYFISSDISGKDEDHVQWTKLLLGALNELINFIKKNHTTGLVWNVKVKHHSNIQIVNDRIYVWHVSGEHPSS